MIHSGSEQRISLTYSLYMFQQGIMLLSPLCDRLLPCRLPQHFGDIRKCAQQLHSIEKTSQFQVGKEVSMTGQFERQLDPQKECKLIQFGRPGRADSSNKVLNSVSQI
jgi:hypothetical protein